MEKPVSRRPSGILALIAALACAVSTAMGQEERLPIIARMQVVFSMVSHYNHISDRIAFYNTYGSPAGNTNYAVPHLVYEPNVTLYNPYNTVLEILKSRVQLSNPPIGFKFQKNNVFLRTEFGNGVFMGLARFQIDNEFNVNAQKAFTMILGGGTPDDYFGVITLQPGESKTFHVRVESSWNWGLETAVAYVPRAFFDWNASRDFTNIDRRTNNAFGVESVASAADYRAGFQTDSLSVTSGRPLASKYPFESSQNYGGPWVAIKKTDTVSVEARGMRTVVSAGVPDFRLSLLRGQIFTASADTVRNFDFKIADLIRPRNEVGNVTDVSRTYTVGDILQTPNDPTSGGKAPFATFTIAAKANALRQGLFLAATPPPTNRLYEARLDEVINFSNVAGIGPSDGLVSGIVVSGVERVGDNLVLDVASQPGEPLGRLMGTTDPALGFPDDQTGSCTIMAGPEGTGLFKVTLPVGTLGERYFVRFER